MTLTSGSCDARFEVVRGAFERNFAELGEVGAALSVRVGGREVVDLWGGSADPKKSRVWERDTLVQIFSSTKGATSTLMHHLAQRGRLSIDKPIANVWPEFAAAGKGDITPRMVLTHQAGLSAIDEQLPVEAAYDAARMSEALAAQRPHWEPGSAHGYSPFTFGWILGECVRRTAGVSLGRVFAEELAGPLELAFFIGLPESYEPRVAKIVPAPPPKEITPMLAAMMDPTSLTARSFLNPMTFFAPGQTNSRAMRAAEIPAANGVADARSVARLYGELLNPAGRLGAERLAEIEAVASDGDDRVLLHHTRFSAGFMKPMHGFRMGGGARAFGHCGAGGSFGMADPDADLAIGYVMNQMGTGTLLNDRGQGLIDAVYDALG